jgi:uncharacterized membrane protein
MSYLWRYTLMGDLCRGVRRSGAAGSIVEKSIDERIKEVTVNLNTNLKALAIGIIAGMRSLSAPALTSSYLSQNDNLAGSRLKVLASPAASKVLKILAAGEMLADKLPVIPSRVSAGPLIARIASGAISGAAVSAADKKQAGTGAVLGGVAAVAGAYGFYHLRRRIGEEVSVPDAVLGVVEDAIVISGGAAVLGVRPSA